MTPEQLNETFKGFGAIKKDAIQVRSYRVSSVIKCISKTYPYLCFIYEHTQFFYSILQLKGNCYQVCDIRSADTFKLVLQVCFKHP